MRQTTVLGLLACVLAATGMVTVQATRQSDSFTTVPLADALGAPKPDAPLARRPAEGIRVRIDRKGFQIAGEHGRVSIASAVPSSSRWARYAHGAARPTSFGRETVVVTPEKTEQFLTVERRQGPKTWKWQLGSAGQIPRVGDDGAIAFLEGHRLAAMHVEPVAILDERGKDITPDGLRWSVAQSHGGWVLKLRLDDSKFPLPYVIDPAVTFRAAASAANATNPTSPTTLVINAPAGIVVNDLLLAQVTVNGGTNTTITPPAGWTLVRRTNNTTNVGVGSYRKVATASEPASYTWNITSSSTPRAAGGILAYYGVDNSAPIDVSSGGTGNSASVVAPSVTTTAANHMVAGLFGSDTGTTFTPPGGTTERYDVRNAAANGPSSEAADFVQATAGATGTRTATAGAAANYAAQLVALKLDVTNPTGSVTAPASSANVRGNAVAVSSNSADGGSGVANAQFQRSPAGAGTWTNIGVADTTSPYSVNWDTTAVADGLYDLRVITTDNAANTFTSALVTNVRVDNTNPTGAITAPASSANVRGNAVAVSSNSADGGSGVANAQFQRSPAGAGTWTNIGAADTTSPYSVAWDTTAVADGLYDLRVTTTDNAGNTFTSALVTNVRVDNTNPTGSITAPASSANVRGNTVAVSSNSADGGSGVANAQFQRSPAGAGTWTNIGAADTTSPYSVAWDTTAVADGLYDLRVVTTDNAGNTFTSALITNVRVDNTNPTGAITAPASSANVRGNAVTVSSNSADGGSGVANAQFQRSPAGAGTWTNIGAADTTSPYSVAWDTTAVADGLYDLRVTTTDNAGNTFTSALVTNVRVDNTNPTGSITAPASSANVRGNAVAVSSNSADGGSGVAQADFQRSPAGAGTWTSIATDSSSPYSVNWDTTAIADGLYDLRVITTDNTGNTFTSALVTNVRVDNTNPTGSLTAPSSGANVRGNAVAVSSNSADGGSGVAQADFQRSPAGAGTWTSIATDSSSPYSVNWDTTAVADGLYDLRVITTDNAGNTFTSALVTNVRVDNTNPTGSITVPSAGANVRGASVTVSSNSADGGSGVASAQFQRSPSGAGTWTNIGAADTTSPYSVAWDTTALADGLYDLRVITTDNVANTFTSALITVRVDNTNPTGSLTAPSSGANVRGNAVAVSSNSADGGSGVAQADFQRSPAGAGTWTSIATDSSSPYSVNWDTTAVADGLYDLRVITTDNAGNTFTSALVTNVRVDNTNPTGSITVPSAGANVRGASVTVSSNSADGGSGVASAQFQRSPSGAGTWTNIGAADTTSPYSVAWDTTALADGLYDLRVITTDNVANTFTSALITVRVDNTNPTGSLTAPSSGANVRGNAVAVSSNSADGGSGVAQADFQRSPAGAGTWTSIATDSSSPYSVNWDTTAVADGLYDLRVITTDNAGNTFTSALVTNVRVDNTNPTGSLTAPSSGANVRGSAVAVSSNSADGGSGVAQADFQRSPAGAGTWTSIATDSSSPYSISWDTTAVADGLYDLRVVTTDNAGNTFTSALVTNVRVDNTNPTGSLTAPSSGANVRGSAVAVSSNSADGGSGVAQADFQRSPAGAGTWTSIATDSSSPYSVNWDTTAVADGLYDLRVITTDNAGNTFTSALVTNVRVDNTNPTGSITAPSTGAYVAGSAVAVSSNSADGGSGVTNAQFQRSPAGGGVWTSIATDNSSPYSVAWDTTAVADGLYDLRVITTDNAGNTFTSALVTNVRVDNAGPTGSITAPSSGANVRGPAVTVSSSSADGGSGVASAQFQRSPAGAGTWTNIGAADTTSPYSVNWDTTAVTDGLYDLRVITTDNAGNTFTSALVTNVRVDNTNPTGSITTPASGANVSGSAVAVSSNSADGGSGVAQADFQRSPAGGGTWTSIATDSSSPYSVNWDTTAVADGLYDLRVITTDNAGNTFTSALVTNVRVDNTNPTGSITAPSAGANVRGNAVTVSSNSADSGSGVASAQFQRSPTGAGTWTNIGAADTTSPYSVAWDTTALTDGLYDLRVITTDNIGHSFTSALITVRVDNTNPTGSLTAPSNGANVSGSAVAVSSNSADGGSGVANAQFQRSPAGGGVWTTIATDNSSPYSVAWDTTAVADGLYDLRVITTDNAGNTFTSALVTNVRVDNAGPTGSITAPSSGANVRGSSVTVSSNSADGGSGVASAQFQRSPAGAGTWTNIGAADTTSPYSVNWDTTAVTDGLYDLRVITTDNAGNTFTSALVTNVRVDNTNPTGSLTAPSNGANVSGSAVAVSSNSADGGSGVAQADFQRSPAGGGTWTSIATDSSSPYSVNWDTTAVADGLYDLRVITTDNAGNTFTSALVTNVRVDNTNPTGSITAPSAGANVRGNAVTVSSNSADSGSGVASAQFQRSPTGAGTWTNIGAADTTSPYSVAWDTTALTDGLYDLRVITTDNIGHSFTSALVTVRVDNTNPTGSLTAPSSGANVRGNAVAVSSNSADGGSGVAQADFQRSPAGGGVWTSIATDNSSPYSVAWDTTAVADGLYDLRVITTDNAGNTFTSALITVRVDNTNPTGSITAPSAGADVRGPAVTVSSSSADGGSGVAQADFQRSPAGAGTWTTIATDSSSPYSVDWDTTALADGLYDLRVVTTDNAGNTFTSALVTDVRVDNTNPTGSLTAPSAGANLRGSAVTLSSDSADSGSGVANAQFQHSPSGAGTWTTIGTDTSSPYSADWDTTAVADGLYDLRVITTDNAGNTFTSALVTVRVDNTNPTGSLTAPNNGANVTGSAVPVSSDSADSGSGVASADFQRSPAGAGTWTTIAADSASPYSVNWDTTALADGPYDLRVVTTDNAGNSFTSAVHTVTVDNSAPAAPTLSFGSFTNASATGSTVYYRAGATGGFTVTGTSGDAHSGIDHLTFPALGSGWTGGGADSSSPYEGVYAFGAGAADPVEPNDVTATNNAGLVSSPTSFTVTPDGTTPVTTIACDSASCSGNWYTSSVSVSLAANDGESGVDRIRYTTDGTDPTPVNGNDYVAPFNLAVTTTVKFRAYDQVGNEEAVGSQLVRIDDSPPSAPALTVSESPASANQHVSGTTLYYNPQGGNNGSFAVDAATGDAQSGIDKVTFPALTGMTGGGDDSSSPYQDTYSWTASSSASGAQSVVSHNNAGLTASSSFTVTPDTAPPSTGFVSYPGGYQTGSITITTDDGTDALSGVNAATGVIERDSAPLVDGSCDPFPDSWITVTSPDSTIQSGNCYRYRYRVADNVGNYAVYTSGAVVKVSTAAPSAPDLTLSESPASANQHVAGSTIFYNPAGSNSGTFTVSATIADSGGSGIDHVSFPALSGMTGGGDDTSSPYQSSYDWTSGSSASGPQTVTVHNNAGLTSSRDFTVTIDTVPPSGQSAGVTGGYYTALSVPVSLSNGGDALSGVDASSGVVERESGSLSNGSCVGWSGTWAPVTLSGGADTTVLSNECYRYRYTISDNVGNPSTPSAPSLDAKVDATVPVTSDDAPAAWQNVAVTVTLSVTETGSGVASTVYRVDGGSFQSGTSISVPAPADHSNDGVHTIEYRSTDNAGNVELLRSATVRIDTTLPTTTDDAPAGWRSSDVTVTLSPSDALSGIASTEYRVDGGVFQNGTSVLVPAPADHSNDGVHLVEYRSTDNAGNVEPLRSATVRIDTELPSGGVTAPPAGAHVNGNVPISAAASDVTSGVASVEFLVRPNGSGSFQSISTDTSAPYDATWDSTGAAEGNADLEVIVIDNAGLSVTSALRTIVVDNPPVPTLVDPGDNIAGTVTLQASSQPDTAQVVFERSLAGQGTWTQIAVDTTAPFTADFDTTGVLDGNYDFRAVATDLGGFDGTSALQGSLVDNTVPTALVTDPASGAVVGGPNVHLGANATDSGSGVASVQFEQRPASGGAFTPIGTDTSSPYEASWDTTGLNGAYELRAVATDAAGNQASAATVPVTVDQTAASVTLADPGLLLRGVVSLTASAPSLHVASVAFERRAAGGSWTRIALDTSRPFEASLDTKTLNDGLYDLRALALGAGGQELATHTRGGIRLDNTAPKMVSSTPARGAKVGSATSIVLVASEPIGSTQGVTLDGSPAAGAITNTKVTFSTGKLGPGRHELTGTLVDAAGNAGAFQLAFTVEVKAQAKLKLQVGKPTAKTRGSQKVFSVTLTLSVPAKVEATLLSPTGRKLRTFRASLPAGRHSVKFTVPVASVPPGRYTIRVVATAADGAKVERRVQLTIPSKRASTPAGGGGNERPKTIAVAAPLGTPPTGGTETPPKTATQPQPAATKPKPKPSPRPKISDSGGKHLEATSKYDGSRRSKTIGLLAAVLALGAALAFLIRIELGRILASPRR